MGLCVKLRITHKNHIHITNQVEITWADAEWETLLDGPVRHAVVVSFKEIVISNQLNPPKLIWANAKWEILLDGPVRRTVVKSFKQIVISNQVSQPKLTWAEAKWETLLGEVVLCTTSFKNEVVCH